MGLGSIVASAGGRVVGMAAMATDAERMAETLRPDVVLMDVRLRGDRDGIASAHVITERLEAAVVFVTGNEDAETVARVPAVSGGAPVRKPVDPRALIDAVLRALARKARGSGALCG